MSPGDGEEIEERGLEGFRLPAPGEPLAYSRGDGFESESRITVRDEDGFNRWSLSVPAARALVHVLRARGRELRDQEDAAMRERRSDDGRAAGKLAAILSGIRNSVEVSIGYADRAATSHAKTTSDARARLRQLRNQGDLFSLSPVGTDGWEKVRASLPWDR